MDPARFSVQQPVLVNLVAVSAVVVGAVLYMDATREAMPAVPIGACSIATLYPGASPLEVEQLVTIPLEEAVDGVDAIANVYSDSQDSLSFLWIELDPSTEDVGRAVIEIVNAVNRVTLPADAERPVVEEAAVRVPITAVAVRGDVPEEALRDVTRRLESDLSRIDGVGDIQPAGIRDRQILVEVDPDRLAARQLPLAAVSASLGTRGQNVPAGTLDGGRSSYLVRALTGVRGSEEVERVVVRPEPGGRAVRVEDVAAVSDGFADAPVSARVNGEPAMLLIVLKDAVSDSLRLSAAIRALLEDTRAGLPDGVSLEMIGDSSHEVARSLSILYSNAGLGLLLVLAVLWAFVRFRNSVMAALGIPVALAAAVIAMHLMGVTINLLSLMALILCLGVIVDDAIIIIENVYRHMEEGKPRRQAAIDGTREVFWPVLSSTLTTCAAFLPLMLMTGVLGEFFAIIPKVVVAALLGSLLEAFFILPSHMAEFGAVRADRPSRLGAALARAGTALGARFTHALRWSLGRRKRLTGLAYVACVGLLVAAFATKDVVMFSESDTDVVDVRVRMPTDASPGETDAVMVEVERRLLSVADEDVEAVVTTRGYTRTDLWPQLGDHLGMATLYLVPQDRRSGPTAGREHLERVTRLFDDLVGPTRLEVQAFEAGPPKGAPVAVRVLGDDLDRLAELADVVVGQLRQIPGTRDVVHDHELGKRELRVIVDEDRAALHGLTPTGITGWLAGAFGGAPTATTRVDGEEVDIVVRLDDRARRDPATLASLSLVTPAGQDVSLGDLASVEHARGPATIRRRDRQRAITITAQITEGQTTSQAVNVELARRLAPLLRANPDVTFEQGGEFERTNESLVSLAQAFLVAALLIYTILAAQFRSFLQPLVVMAAIPLSLIGVAVGFLASGEPIGLIALVGVVGLAGIVVNDSIVLVSFINERRRDGLGVDDAIVEAARLRLRPILLTSVTTIAGLLPLAIGVGGRSPLLAPMCTAIAWGLTFATVLTLVLVPCFYRSVFTLSALGSRLFAAAAPAPAPSTSDAE